MDNQKKLAENNKHISSSEIKQDIADTQAEVVMMRREEEGYRLIGDKMSVFRADARRLGIKERQKFIKDLKSILQYRKPKKDKERFTGTGIPTGLEYL